MGNKQPTALVRFRDELRAQYTLALARDSIDQDMMQEGVAGTVKNTNVNLIILAREELRRVFQNQGFSSHADMLRVEHVFTLAASQVQEIGLAKLFGKLKEVPSTVRSVAVQTMGVLAVSSAGCGKTYVFTKVAPLRWAAGKFWSQFDIVVFGELRYPEVRMATGICELLDLKGHNIINVADQEAICKYVREHPERICVILDGLDETSLADCGKYVQTVIRGEALIGIRLIVTSRPCADVITLSEMAHFQQRVELMGFRPADVTRYVKKVLKPDKAEELLREISNDKHLASMVATPVMARSVCNLFHHTGDVPRCVSDIFETHVLLIAELTEGRRFRTWEGIPAELQQLILDLGAFAFKMLIAKRLVFTEVDIKRYAILVEAIALGLLVVCDPAETNKAQQWRFSHLTMQEALAAKYQACYREMTLDRIVRLVDSLGPCSDHLRTFWIILTAQLDQTNAERLIECLMLRSKTREWEEDDKVDERQLWQFCPFPLNFVSPLCEVARGHHIDRLAEELLSDKIAGSDSGREVVQRKMGEHRETSNASFLKTLLLTWADMEGKETATSQTLTAALQKIDTQLHRHCQDYFKLRQASASISPADKALRIIDLKRGGEDRQSLVFHCFAEYATCCRGKCKPFRVLQEYLHGHDVFFSGLGRQHPADQRANVIVANQHATKLRMYNFSSISPYPLPASLAQCSNALHLKVEYWEELYDLVPALMMSSSATLTRLTIDDTRVNDRQAAVLSTALSKCFQLTHLRLHHTQLSSAAATPLADALSNLACLTYLDLSGNPALGDSGMAAICRSLGGSSLLEISLSDCRLSAFILPVIARCAKRLPSLRILDLSGCDNSGSPQVCQFQSDVKGDGRRLLVLGLFSSVFA